MEGRSEKGAGEKVGVNLNTAFGKSERSPEETDLSSTRSYAELQEKHQQLKFLGLSRAEALCD